jgi:hypothetical protein
VRAKQENQHSVRQTKLVTNTITVKQIKVLKWNSYDQCEREAFRDIIFGNILYAMLMLVRYTRIHDIEYSSYETETIAERWLSFDNDILINVLKVWSRTLVEELKLLWLEEAIQIAYSNRNKMQLPESTGYYMEHLDRVVDGTPNEQDVLRSKVKTTGIVETTCDIDGKKVGIMDTGGQRNERKSKLT